MPKVMLITGGSRGIGAATAHLTEAVLWLASDKAAYCVGTILDVTGGR